MWKTVATITVVTVGACGLVATRCDAAIFSPGVSRTGPVLSLATTMFESIRAIRLPTRRLTMHRRRPATPQKGA